MFNVEHRDLLQAVPAVVLNVRPGGGQLYIRRNLTANKCSETDCKADDLTGLLAQGLKDLVKAVWLKEVRFV